MGVGGTASVSVVVCLGSLRVSSCSSGSPASTSNRNLVVTVSGRTVAVSGLRPGSSVVYEEVEMVTVDDAHSLATRAHGTDRSRFGVLFIDHVCRVAAPIAIDPDRHAVPSALLHDTVEKGTLQWDDLPAAGAGDRLIAVVDALTEHEGEADSDHVARCAADPLALRIKRVDVADS
jgi:hypothetical protein